MFVHKRSITIILASVFCLQLPLYAFNDKATQNLIDGIKEGNVSKVKKSIDNGADINASVIGEDKETPLMLALREYVHAFQEHIKFTSPWSLAHWGSIAGLGAGAVGFITEPKRKEYEDVSTRTYISIGAMIVSALSFITASVLTLTVSNLAKKAAIFNALLDNPATDVSLKNSNDQTILTILDSYAPAFKQIKHGSSIYTNFRGRIESKIPTKK